MIYTRRVLIASARKLASVHGSRQKRTPHLLLMLTMAWSGSTSVGAHATSVEPLRLSALALEAKMSSNRHAKHLLALDHKPKCGIEVRPFNYENRVLGGTDYDTVTIRPGTGALFLPYSPDADSALCAGNKPTVLYLHMKNNRTGYDLAALNDNRNPAYDEALTIAALYAAHGYIVVAPHYASNYGTTRPYETAIDSIVLGNEATDAYLDAMAQLASRSTSGTVRPSGKLLVTGYGEGAAIATSASSALAMAQVNVSATAAGSGPYAIPSFNEYVLNIELAEPAKDLQTQALLRNLALSFQYSYGNIHTPAQTSQLGSAEYLRQYREASANNTPQPLRDAINRNYIRLIAAPETPALFCGSRHDEIVPYFNTDIMAQYHDQQSGSSSTRYPLITMDLSIHRDDMLASYPEPLKHMQQAFQKLNRQATRRPHSSSTAALDYHERMFPFCGLAGLRHFAPVLKSDQSVMSVAVPLISS